MAQIRFTFKGHDLTCESDAENGAYGFDCKDESISIKLESMFCDWCLKKSSDNDFIILGGPNSIENRHAFLDEIGAEIVNYNPGNDTDIVF